MNKVWRLGIIGMGNLGFALIAHSNFPRQGYHFVAAFDIDPLKIGKMLPQGFPISPMSDLGKIVLELGIEIAVISTPASKAQDAANLVVKTPHSRNLKLCPGPIACSGRVYCSSYRLYSKIRQTGLPHEQSKTGILLSPRAPLGRHDTVGPLD